MIADLVYDVGVNNGDDSAYYLSRGYRVVGVEANPFLIPHLQERFASEIAEGRYSLLNLAIGKSTGSVPFHVAAQNRAIWSSLDARPVRARGVETVVVEVPCVRFEGILAEHGVPYYLKIDIEGADHFCLRDLSAEDAPEFVSFEASEGDLAHLSYLYVAGYRRYRLVDQLDGFRVVRAPERDSLELAAYTAKAVIRNLLPRRPTRVRWPLGATDLRPTMFDPPPTDAPETFRISSSGPMPHTMPGEWMSFAELAWTWLCLVNRRHRANWYDVHAAR